MKTNMLSRREFLRQCVGLTAGVTIASLTAKPWDLLFADEKPAVSIVKIKNDNIPYAVEKAIDLLGGIETLTKGKDRIMLKPNLTGPEPKATTKPEVIKTLAQLMKKSGKEVSIGEGSAGAPGFNIKNRIVCRTRNKEILDDMQQFIFDKLGYFSLAKSMKIPLINLHSGEMVDVMVPKAYVFEKITLHRSLTDIDLLCSVPMMKTHALAQVTLGMKNLFGLFPGSIYYAVRGLVHELTGEIEPSGTAAAIVDMVRANKCGLVVIDGSTAMEGQGPSLGPIVKTDLIIAGMNPLATDIVAANIMGFEPEEIPTFVWAGKAAMKPTRVEEIEVRGEPIANVRRNFARARIVPWAAISNTFGKKEVI
jgi:uncharacterized protein (DUF362 family)